MMLATSMYMTPKARAVPTAKARVAHSDMRQAAVWRRGLRIFENITDSTNGVDQGAHGIAIHLGTQAVDVNIHHVGSGINAHAPHVIENHGTGDHAADVAAQIFQEREFLRGELQEMVAATGFAADQVEFKIGDAQFYRFFLSRAGAAQEVAQAGHEFSESKGLGEVIVAALFEPAYPIVHGAAGGEDQDRRHVSLGAAAADQVEAIQIGKAEINDHGIMNALGGERFGGAGIGGYIHLVAGFDQRALKEFLNRFVVFHD